MFDPFTASDPPVLVHEVDGPDFERSWHGFDREDEGWKCPVCGEGKQHDRGVSEHKQRPWVRYSCGDVITQEITAG